MALCFALRGRDAQKYHPITAGITAAGCPDAGDRGGARRRRGIYFKNVLYLRTILQELFLSVMSLPLALLRIEIRPPSFFLALRQNLDKQINF